MGSNRKLLFGVLLVVGAVVFWGLFRIIGSVKSAATPTPVPVALINAPRSGHMVARATQDIPEGSLVTKSMYEMAPLQGAASTTNFVTDPATEADGFVTKVKIPKGSFLTPADDFLGHITEVGVGGMLRPGYRAIIVPFANKPTLHDLVHIGNFIDINAAFDGQEARTIVPDVRVLAVDVFGSDFPQVNIAARGPFKADLKGSGAAVPVPGEPGATPTPTPAPAQAPPRPDPAVTLEVTPAQANSILLAQASGATLDFVVLPASPSGDIREPGIVPGAGGSSTTDTSGFHTVSVTKAQLAPYAEGKKSSNASAQAKSDPTGIKSLVSTIGKMGQKPVIDRGPMPVYPQPSSNTTLPPANFQTSTEPVASPTYDIPIYADGKTVRVETVRRPQD